MSILLSLSPFAVFFVLMRLHSPITGLLGALAASLVLLARMRRRREAVKILEVGTLALFALLTAYTWIGSPNWTVATVRLAVDVGLLAIVLVSLAVGQPFTIQYARACPSSSGPCRSSSPPTSSSAPPGPAPSQ